MIINIDKKEEAILDKKLEFQHKASITQLPKVMLIHKEVGGSRNQIKEEVPIMQMKVEDLEFIKMLLFRHHQGVGTMKQVDLVELKCHPNLLELDKVAIEEILEDLPMTNIKLFQKIIEKHLG